jgi:actin-related protein
VVVVDIGSGSIKAGWAGEDAPRGSLRINVTAAPLPQTSPFAANNLLSSLVAPAGVITHPVTHGSITDFSVFAKVMEDMYEDILECNSKEHSLLMTYSFAMSLAERTQLAQLMFERFQVPSLALINTSSLSLFSTGMSNSFPSFMLFLSKRK